MESQRRHLTASADVYYSSRMKSSRLTPARLEAAGIGAFFRPRDLESLEIPFTELQRLVAAGTVEKVSPGLYRLSAAKPSLRKPCALSSSWTQREASSRGGQV